MTLSLSNLYNEITNINLITEVSLDDIKKEYYILYHGSDSKYFDRFDATRAEKGSNYFNPLGSGLYCTTYEKMARTFGKNIYIYLLPKSAKIKKITLSKWQLDYLPFAKKCLSKGGIKWDDLKLTDKVEINKAGRNDPISSLYDLEFWMDELGIENTQKIITQVSDDRNKMYDAIWYKSTSFENGDEIIIPSDKFDPNNFKAPDYVRNLKN